MATDPRDSSHWLHVLVFLLLLPAHEVIEGLSQGHFCMFLCSKITFLFLLSSSSKGLWCPCFPGWADSND